MPAHCGRHLWEALIAAGEAFDITPYGTESMHVLRAEKGFIIVGQDTDGSMTPADMNMDWVVAKNKTFSFIGKRSLQAQRRAARSAQAIRRISAVEPKGGAPRGRAGGVRSATADPDVDAGPCDVELLQRQSWALVCIGGDQGRSQSDGSGGALSIGGRAYPGRRNR